MGNTPLQPLSEAPLNCMLAEQDIRAGAPRAAAELDSAYTQKKALVEVAWSRVLQGEPGVHALLLSTPSTPPKAIPRLLFALILSEQVMFTTSLGAGATGRVMETRERTAGQEAIAMAPQPLLLTLNAALKPAGGAPCGALTVSSGVGHTETVGLERQLQAAGVWVALSVAVGEGELLDDLLSADEGDGGAEAETAPEAVAERVDARERVGEALARTLMLPELE